MMNKMLTSGIEKIIRIITPKFSVMEHYDNVYGHNSTHKIASNVTTKLELTMGR